MKYSKYDIVIIGSGLAGLYLAKKLSSLASFQDGIALITKEDVFSGSTSLAQGGIVSVIPELNPNDSIESHIKDTLKAGCGLNDINAVKFVSENSYIAAQELINFGVEFDTNASGGLNFTLEGAHSHPRILHCKGDSTGHVIEETLSQSVLDVDIYLNTQAIELLCDKNNICRGIITFNHRNKSYEAIYSNNVVIATGGIGQLYSKTTNPKTQTADGISLAHRAGAELRDMEFVQFHPTALYCKNKSVLPLVSESARGEGAKLVNINGDYFAKNYHHQADLAPRDIISRAIFEQMQTTKNPFVNLDISQIGIENFKKRFPTISRLCEENEIDITSGLIPVAPAQHYFMGGIKVNLNSETTIKNLYAIGECASVGLHGANRLASNSLLECAVFAHSLAHYLAKNYQTPPKKHDEKIQKTLDSYSLDDDGADFDEISADDLFEKLKTTMTDNVGIIRNQKSLNSALDTIFEINSKLRTLKYKDRSYFELQSALDVAGQIVQAALLRENSIGAHFRSDYPTQADKKDIMRYPKLAKYQQEKVK